MSETTLQPKMSHRFRVEFLNAGVVVFGSEVLSEQVTDIDYYNQAGFGNFVFEDDEANKAQFALMEIAKTEGLEIVIVIFNKVGGTLERVHLQNSKIENVSHTKPFSRKVSLEPITKTVEFSFGDYMLELIEPD